MKFTNAAQSSSFLGFYCIPESHARFTEFAHQIEALDSKLRAAKDSSDSFGRVSTWLVTISEGVYLWPFSPNCHSVRVGCHSEVFLSESHILLRF